MYIIMMHYSGVLVLECGDASHVAVALGQHVLHHDALVGGRIEQVRLFRQASPGHVQHPLGKLNLGVLLTFIVNLRGKQN